MATFVSGAYRVRTEDVYGHLAMSGIGAEPHADGLVVVADTNEFLGADLDDRNAGLVVMEVRNDFVSHDLHTCTCSVVTPFSG